MKKRWSSGIFLEKLWSSDECIIFSDEGKIVKARSIRLKPECESWQSDEIVKLTTTRWRAQLLEDEIQLEERHVEGEDDDPVLEREIVPRDFNITKEHLDKFGYSGDWTVQSFVARRKPVDAPYEEMS